MNLPVVAFGDPVLREVCEDIDQNYPNLTALIADMYETMASSNGVGLAAPQIGLPIRLFLVDTTVMVEEGEEPDFTPIKKTFINATILDENGERWSYEEGCLSIPHIRESVSRHDKLVIEYYDENFQLKEETYDGINARVIQHEYDHIEGILFIDYLKPLKKRMLKKKLDSISKGLVRVDYKMKFPLASKAR